MEMGHSRSKNQDAIDGRRVDENEAQGMRGSVMTTGADGDDDGDGGDLGAGSKPAVGFHSAVPPTDKCIMHFWEEDDDGTCGWTSAR